MYPFNAYFDAHKGALRRKGNFPMTDDTLTI